MRTTLTVLGRARNRIQRGWVQKEAETDDGRVCLSQALSIASGHQAQKYESIVARQIGDESINVINWNDTPGRTKDEVLDALDKAISAELMVLPLSERYDARTLVFGLTQYTTTC